MSSMAIKLTTGQARALRGIDMMRRSGGADMETLRANGNRRDVVDRLCGKGLAFAVGDYGDRDRIRFDLTQKGREVLAGMEEA
jgi:hypothetical protein